RSVYDTLRPRAAAQRELRGSDGSRKNPVENQADGVPHPAAHRETRGRNLARCGLRRRTVDGLARNRIRVRRYAVALLKYRSRGDNEDLGLDTESGSQLGRRGWIS